MNSDKLRKSHPEPVDIAMRAMRMWWAGLAIVCAWNGIWAGHIILDGWIGHVPWFICSFAAAVWSWRIHVHLVVVWCAATLIFMFGMRALEVGFYGHELPITTSMRMTATAFWIFLAASSYFASIISMAAMAQKHSENSPWNRSS